MKSRRKSQPAKIADVARIAGVSVATVSRALATPGIVSEETRAKVVAAVQRVGYTPNVAAQNLRARRSRMALVVVPNIENPFFSGILHGIDEALSAAGYGFIVANLGDATEKESRYVDLATAGLVDGVLLLCGHVPQGAQRSLDETRLPIVAACEFISGARFPQVEVDNRAAAREAVEYLVGLGHRRIGYVSGPPRNVLDRARRAGYRDAIGEAAPIEWDGDFTFAAGAAAARAFLAMPERLRPSAIFAANDEMAIGFLKSVHAAGLAVPDDVSVVGFDGIEYAEYCEPSLTTVVQPRRDIGIGAGRLLVDLMEGVPPTPTVVRIPTQLVVRGSTAPRAARRSA
ncbi:MAG: LacI family DNA-binding transcriptional regulator [Rhodospirillales bacterium]|nr:LacI family DNA-binding transcriptional regulator [Rhodospirillales bacterium]